MTRPSSAPSAWAPPSDDDLSWFKPGEVLPSPPTPFAYSFSVAAFAFGVSRALESLYFPLYELRPRLISGELYFASVPSAMAEADLEAQLGRMRDSGLRFTRSVRGGWERAIRREVAEYNERFAAFAPPSASDGDVDRSVLALRRTRANQWFAATRAVFAPTVMLQHGIGASSVDEALEVAREALDAIRLQGWRLLDEAIGRIGARLVRAGCIEAPPDLVWLDQIEVRESLSTGADRTAIVRERQLGSQTLPAEGPDWVGPALATDAPRMYLVREVLALMS